MPSVTSGRVEDQVLAPGLLIGNEVRDLQPPGEHDLSLFGPHRGGVGGIVSVIAKLQMQRESGRSSCEAFRELLPEMWAVASARFLFGDRCLAGLGFPSITYESLVAVGIDPLEGMDPENSDIVHSWPEEQRT